MFGLVASCGDGQTSLGAGGAGGDGPPSQVVAEVRLATSSLVGTRIGQRWALVATAIDTQGEPIPDVTFEWESSADDVATVDADGLITTLAVGEARITATAGGQTASVELSSNSAVPSDVGEMYTVWFARSDEAAVAIVDGRLEVFGAETGSGLATTPWPYAGVASFQVAGDRLAILTDVAGGRGTLRVLDRHEEWSIARLAEVTDFQLENDRLAVLDADGSLRVREGGQGAWTTVAPSGVRQFQFRGGRIAILTDDGRLRAKDSLADVWTDLATGVRSFLLSGDRIAVLVEEGDGELRVKDGLDGPWTALESGVLKVQLSGDRIGVLRKDGVARLKEEVDGPWTLLASSYVEDLQLDGDRITMMFEGGDLRAKDNLDDPWTVLAARSRSYVLQGDRIGMLTTAGELWFTAGIGGVWSEVSPDGAVTQFVPVADIPAPPFRTAVSQGVGQLDCEAVLGAQTSCPVPYADAQQACVDDGSRCSPAPEALASTTLYGRFCGDTRPRASDWVWANGPDVGPIDSLDALCMHEDNAEAWYPAVDEELRACIVEYGVAFARLTRDGEAIARDTVAYAEIMGQMPNLRDALSGRASEDCTAGQLDAFVEVTRAKR
ncbi:MAG: Ig-like domain-containing protein [Myxococcota bacterium]